MSYKTGAKMLRAILESLSLDVMYTAENGVLLRIVEHFLIKLIDKSS